MVHQTMVSFIKCFLTAWNPPRITCTRTAFKISVYPYNIYKLKFKIKKNDSQMTECLPMHVLNFSELLNNRISKYQHSIKPEHIKMKAAGTFSQTSVITSCVSTASNSRFLRTMSWFLELRNQTEVNVLYFSLLSLLNLEFLNFDTTKENQTKLLMFSKIPEPDSPSSNNL